jgi:hypothetical protein
VHFLGVLPGFPMGWKAADLERDELGCLLRGFSLFSFGVDLAQVIPMLIMFERFFGSNMTAIFRSDKILYNISLGA